MHIMKIDIGLLLLVAFLTSNAHSHAIFLLRIPNGIAPYRPGTGITCTQLGHERCRPGAPRNPFGLDFKAAGLKWTKELCMKDSDGDGLTNGEELGDPCCKWTAEAPEATELRTNLLSHPGDAEKDGAKFAPKCADMEASVSPSLSPSPSASQMCILPNTLGICRKSSEKSIIACSCSELQMRTGLIIGTDATIKRCSKLLDVPRRNLPSYNCACSNINSDFRREDGKIMKKKFQRRFNNLIDKCRKKNSISPMETMGPSE